MSSYTTLIGPKTADGSIKNWVNKPDIPATTILDEAQALIYRTLRVREMKFVAPNFVFAEGDSEKALPENFLDPISLVPYGWGCPLDYYHEETYDPIIDSEGVHMRGTPSRWTIMGETAYLDVACQTEFGCRLTYYGLPPVLSADNPTNFLTRRYPSLVRYACMTKAYEHMKDTGRTQEYLTYTMGEIANVGVTDDLHRRGQMV